jgi:hypothetical protein
MDRRSAPERIDAVAMSRAAGSYYRRAVPVSSESATIAAVPSHVIEWSLTLMVGVQETDRDSHFLPSAQLLLF